MTTIDNKQLVTVAGGYTMRPDGGTCTQPSPRPGQGPLNPFNPRPIGPGGFPGGLQLQR